MKLAFVDLDYTVLVNPFWPAVFPHFARHVGVAVAVDAVRAGRRSTDLMARSKALSLAGDVGANDWDRLMRECAVGFGATWSEPVAALVERYRGFAVEVPGAREMLAALRAAGWTCVAASAGYRRFQLPSLAHLGLLHCFDGLRFADDAGTLKRRLAFYGAIPTGRHARGLHRRQLRRRLPLPGALRLRDGLVHRRADLLAAALRTPRRTRTSSTSATSSDALDARRFEGAALPGAGPDGVPGMRRAGRRGPSRARCAAASPAATASTGTGTGAG